MEAVQKAVAEQQAEIERLQRLEAEAKALESLEYYHIEQSYIAPVFCSTGKHWYLLPRMRPRQPQGTYG